MIGPHHLLLAKLSKQIETGMLDFAYQWLMLYMFQPYNWYANVCISFSQYSPWIVFTRIHHYPISDQPIKAINGGGIIRYKPSTNGRFIVALPTFYHRLRPRRPIRISGTRSVSPKSRATSPSTARSERDSWAPCGGNAKHLGSWTTGHWT